MEIIISAVIGLIAGAIGSLIAPWVNWGIEKKKIRLEERKKILYYVEVELNRYDFSIARFKDSLAYSQIKPYLDTDVDKLIGSERELKNKIFDNITIIRGKWELI